MNHSGQFHRSLAVLVFHVNEQSAKWHRALCLPTQLRNYSCYNPDGAWTFFPASSLFDYFFNLIENFLVHSSSTYLTWFVMAEGFHMKYFHSGFFDNQLHFCKMGQTSNFIDSLDYKQLKWQVTIKLTLLHLDLLTSSLGHSHSRGGVNSQFNMPFMPKMSMRCNSCSLQVKIRGLDFEGERGKKKKNSWTYDIIITWDFLYHCATTTDLLSSI